MSFWAYLYLPFILASSVATASPMIGSGAKKCFQVSKDFLQFEIDRDYQIEVNRAVVEKSYGTPEEKVEKLKELNAPILEKYACQVASFRTQLREFAMGVLQAELIKKGANDRLLELENYNYPDKFLELCKKDAQYNDLYYIDFILQVFEGRHKVSWLRITE